MRALVPELHFIRKGSQFAYIHTIYLGYRSGTGQYTIVLYLYVNLFAPTRAFILATISSREPIINKNDFVTYHTYPVVIKYNTHHPPAEYDEPVLQQS